MFNWFQDCKNCSNSNTSRELVIPEEERHHSIVIPKIKVLLEIVSGIDIRFQNRTVENSSSIDPYCVVKLSSDPKQTVYHKTKAIQNDTNPVWTIKTNSLCILKIPDILTDEDDDNDEDENINNAKEEEKQEESDEKKETITDKKTDEQQVVVRKEIEGTTHKKKNKKGRDDDCSKGYVNIEICHGLSCIGIVNVSFENVLRSNGERVEYPICLRDKSSLSNKSKNRDEDDKKEEEENLGMLALRFRRATDYDVQFMNSGRIPMSFRNSTDINFRKVQHMQTLITTTRKLDVKDGGKIKYRVQPFPDPSRSKGETTWLTKDQLTKESLKPSSKWYETGYGDVGTVYVEVIGCKNLPNLDASAGGSVVGDKSDPFVSIVFEDNMVRTDIIQNTLNPKWMPWCTRAYAFNIVHPSSLLFIGIFDYDGEPMLYHEPIGRVVINTANFHTNTSYLLHYKLYRDVTEEQAAGEITLRLRVSWAKSEGRAKKLQLQSSPPRFLINVNNEKAFKVLRYVCRGPVNMDKPSLASIKLYANELATHIKDYGYVIDVIFGILLWRGRINLRLPFMKRRFNIWFPIQSIVLFVTAILAIEYPSNTIGILILYCSWIMYSINYYASTKSNPWSRVNSVGHDNMVMLTGRSLHGDIRIDPKVGLTESNAMDIVDKYKTDRVGTFFWNLKTVGLKARRIYAKSKVASYSFETEDTSGWSFLNDKFYYPHLLLYYLCTYTRMLRNLVMWKSTSTHVHVLHMTIVGVVFVLFPINHVLQWTARIIAWTALGPWMKLVDILVVHPFFQYKTKEEILETIKSEGDEEKEMAEAKERVYTDLNSILNSETIQKLTKKKRVAAEDATKLKDMRDYKYGTYCETVPQVDTSRHAPIPTFDSTAQPYLGHAIEKEENLKASRPGYFDIPEEKQSWIQIEGQKLGGTMIHATLNTARSAARGSVRERRKSVAHKTDTAVSFD